MTKYAGPDRRIPDPLHQETVALVREVHELEYQKLHPDIQHILDALCGPVDPLSGVREAKNGMNGKIGRMEHEVASMSATLTDLHQNGRVKFSKWAKLFGGVTITGLFSILYLLVEHALGG